MHVHRRNFLAGGVAGLIGYSVRSWAADRPNGDGLAGDVDIIREALKLHPGLYRYNSPAEIDAALSELKRRFASAESSSARYLLLSRFLARIRCGHTYGNFFNQKSAVAADLFDRRTRLPFHFIWIDDGMVVTNDPTASLPRGSRIIELNGRDPRYMLRELMPLVRADGHNDGKRVSLLEVQGTEKTETFDVFQGLLAPPASVGHLIRANLPDGTSKRFDVPAITLAERRQHMKANVLAQESGALWTWQMRADGIAVLTMPTWAVYDSKWDWKSWLSERLDGLAGAKTLIIDLRDNEGGEDCGDPILARLIDQPYTPPKTEQRIRFERTPAAIDKFLDTWDDSFRSLGVGARPLPNGFFLRPDASQILTIDPAAKRLKVPVIVLISPVNSSATFQFAQNFRRIRAGKLVGRTTGGNRRGINGGCFFFVRLPASGLEFDLPLVGNFPTEPQPDTGLEPDVMVYRTVSDVTAGRDSVFERAVALS